MALLSVLFRTVIDYSALPIILQIEYLYDPFFSFLNSIDIPFTLFSLFLFFYSIFYFSLHQATLELIIFNFHLLKIFLIYIQSYLFSSSSEIISIFFHHYCELSLLHQFTFNLINNSHIFQSQHVASLRSIPNNGIAWINPSILLERG